MPYNKDRQTIANKKWREAHKDQYNEFIRNYQREHYDEEEKEKKRQYREKQKYYNYELEAKIFRKMKILF
jgi:hypothetical protein